VSPITRYSNHLITSCDAPFFMTVIYRSLDYSSRMAVVRTGVISMDCADSRSLADFWVAMLGGEVRFTNGGNVVVRTDWVWLCMMPVADYGAPTWPDGACPNRFISISRHRRPRGIRGASHPARGSRGVRATGTRTSGALMLDPAGHPFCPHDAGAARSTLIDESVRVDAPDSLQDLRSQAPKGRPPRALAKLREERSRERAP